MHRCIQFQILQMFFNYDLFEIGSIAFIISVILIKSFYNSLTPINNESLVNTSNTANSTSVIGSNSLQYLESGVQTANTQVEASVQATNTYVRNANIS